MIKISDLVYQARNGSKEAFDKLVKHYEPYFINNVINNNEGDKEELTLLAQEKLPIYLKHYVDNNLSDYLYTYLQKKSKLILKEQYIRNDVRYEKGSQDEKDSVILIYSNRYYDYINAYNDILTEEELRKYCFDYMKKNIEYYVEQKEDMPRQMSRVIFNDKNNFKSNRLLLIKKYIKQESITDGIINYYYKKNEHLLKQFENTPQYNTIKSIYKSTLSDFIVKSENEKTLEKNIGLYLNKVYNVLISEIVNKTKKGFNNDKEYVKETYSYIIDGLYYKFKDKICLSEDVLKELIIIKYNEYFEVYYNGNAKCNVSQYMNTRLNDYLNKLVKLNSWMKKQEQQREKNYIENRENLYRYMNMYNKKQGNFCPFIIDEKNMRDIYDEIYTHYCMKKTNTSFDLYLCRGMSVKLKELNDKNLNNYLNMIISKLKDVCINNNIITEDIIYEVFNNWKEYYLINKLYKQISFEQYMFNNINNFNEEEIKHMLNVKKWNNCKVLAKGR